MAEYVKSQGVDVLLVQEGIRSCFVYDTLQHLAETLGYEYYTKSVFGWPVFWEFRVGIISRFKILSTASLSCEVPQTDWVDSIPLPWRKRAVSVTVDVPDLGITNLISVHLTSNPKPGGKAEQLRKLTEWKASLPARDVTILGGDFNTGFPVDMDKGYGSAPDYIFVEGARITRADLVFEDRVVSDHLGVVVGVSR